MRTLAIVNLKGGTGKTVSAANMAHILAALHRKKVLLVDGDKQGSASRYFSVYGEHDGTAALLLADGLDIITSNLELYAADRALYDRQDTDTARVLSSVLDHVRNDCRAVGDHTRTGGPV